MNRNLRIIKYFTIFNEQFFSQRSPISIASNVGFNGHSFISIDSVEHLSKSGHSIENFGDEEIKSKKLNGQRNYSIKPCRIKSQLKG